MDPECQQGWGTRSQSCCPLALVRLDEASAYEAQPCHLAFLPSVLSHALTGIPEAHRLRCGLLPHTHPAPRSRSPVPGLQHCHLGPQGLQVGGGLQARHPRSYHHHPQSRG